jgi:hypothetical protein
MSQFTEDPSSGGLVQFLAINYNNDSIVSVVMDKVGVNGSIFRPDVRVCSSLCMKVFIHSELHTHTQLVGICCRNTYLVHVNGHDRVIIIIFSQALYKAP